MQRLFVPLLVSLLLVSASSHSRAAETWIKPYLGTGNDGNSVGYVGQTLFNDFPYDGDPSGARWDAWTTTRTLISGVNFHEIATQTMLIDEVFLLDSDEKIELTADEASVIGHACDPSDTPGLAYGRDELKWVAQVFDSAYPADLTDPLIFTPDSIEIGEILNVKRVECGQTIANIQQFYRDYILAIRTDFPTVPINLALKVPAAYPGLDLVPMIQSLIGFLCPPGSGGDQTCPASVTVEPHLFVQYSLIQDQLVRLRNFIVDPAQHSGRQIAFNVYLVDQCAYDPQAGNQVRQRIVLRPGGTASCSNNWGTTLSNWLPNIMAMHSLYTQIFGTPSYATRTEIADWATYTFYDQTLLPPSVDLSTGRNRLVLGETDSTPNTFMTGAKIAAEALIPGSINRYNGPGDHWAAKEVPPLGYHFEAQMGYLRGFDGNAVALYSCMNGSEQFLSRFPNCEGKTSLGFQGWLRHPSLPLPGNTRPLYRCKITGTGDHFASNDVNCEGQISEGLLGHACSTSASC